MALAEFKTTIKAAVASPGLRLAQARHRPGCTVLIYHRVGLASDLFPNLDVENFREQVAWLTKHCNVVAPEELRSRAEWGSPNRPNVMITFDDGYRDYFDHAYPVLRSFRVRAVNFLCTRFNDEAELIGWWDRLFLATRHSSKTSARLPWAAEEYVLDSAGRAALLRAAKDYIKLRPEDEKESLTLAVIDALGVDRETIRAPRQTMSWDEVRAAADFTAYGGHTHNHVIVSRLDKHALDSEIQMCRDRIARETGAAPDTFAYPNGRAIDFTDESKLTLQRFGFSTAFSSIEGVNGQDTDWMAVRRISGGASVTDLAWRLSRLWA